jgi:acyl carrier protein
MLPGSQDPELKLALKQLVVEAGDKPVDPGGIGDEDSLVGRGSALGLDSLDVLQVNVALMNRYGVLVQDSKHARRVMRSINSLADFVQPGA